MLNARALVIVPLAALLAFGAVRAMTFVAPTDHPLRALGPSFAGHPDAITDRAMAEIGAAAGRGEEMPDSARQGLASVAGKAPLAADPFLVEGTIAQMAGNARARKTYPGGAGRAIRARRVRATPRRALFQTKRILRTG